jgi:hypothetical protein
MRFIKSPPEEGLLKSVLLLLVFHPLHRGRGQLALRHPLENDGGAAFLRGNGCGGAFAGGFQIGVTEVRRVGAMEVEHDDEMGVAGIHCTHF